MTAHSMDAKGPSAPAACSSARVSGGDVRPRSGVSDSRHTRPPQGGGSDRGRKGHHQASAQKRHAQPGALPCRGCLPRLRGQSFGGVCGLTDPPKSTLVLYLKITGVFN